MSAMEPPAGIEPAPAAWKAAALPLCYDGMEKATGLHAPVALTVGKYTSVGGKPGWVRSFPYRYCSDGHMLSCKFGEFQ